MDLFNTIFFAFVAGVLPAVVWLVFWLREDADHPEPRRYVLMTFGLGALAVPFALLFQIIFNTLFGIGETSDIARLPFLWGFIAVCGWAFIEEFVKYKAAWHGGLKKTITDEAVDVPIYMISAALGFAALENVLFLIVPLLDGDIPGAILTTKSRFIGASLVHVASSALIGIFAGYSLFFAQKIRRWYLIAGFVLSTVLHAMFNLFIIKNSQNSFAGFLLIWIFVVLIIVLFERIKRIKVNTIDNVREEKKENTD
jgi:RsiW-degrading membrane proteinase PrsW (M82 family)